LRAALPLAQGRELASSLTCSRRHSELSPVQRTSGAVCNQCLQRGWRDLQKAQARDARHQAAVPDGAQAFAEQQARQQRHRERLRVYNDAAQACGRPLQTLRQETLPQQRGPCLASGQMV
jgi:hypothetical protein